MRFIVTSVTGLMLLTGSAQAAVSIVVDKNTQQMTVAVDGVTRYTWPVSSGNPSHETPNGTFRAFRMEQDHYSKEFDDAPMPNAIFFTKQGHAIHGTDSVSRLGSPASHGCVRLSRANALKLWDVVKAEGLLNTTVTLTGSSQVALARSGRARTNVARGDADGQPLEIAPRGGQDVYDESLDANSRARQPSQDRVYRNPYSREDRAYYYGAPSYGSAYEAAGPMQRRVYGARPAVPQNLPPDGYAYYGQDTRYVRPNPYYSGY
ncbi:MAG: L,D-transpeptidase [Afipia sp.]|jgi:hypothetical protein|nr:L,D-transpeptidase [Afipia sp.]